jgi:hypothetical protein
VHDIHLTRSQGEANADLVGAFGDGPRQHPVDAYGRERQRDQTEGLKQNQGEAAFGSRGRKKAVHRRDSHNRLIFIH